MSIDVDRHNAAALLPEQLALLSGPLGTLASRQPSEVRVVSATFLRRGVHRLQLEGATCASVVVKRLPAKASQLERSVTDRWLPSVEMNGFGPPRRAAAGEGDGRYVWHVYDDLGPHGLDQGDVDPGRLGAAMNRLADLHASFARHPMLVEARFAAGDLGTHFYRNSVRDAARCVALLRPPAVQPSAEQCRVRDEVAELLSHLTEDEPDRVRLLTELAGPTTLVHGDLTRANVFVLPEPGGCRLIDWDHAGVGPCGFDISTHVAYYAPAQRRLVLNLYTQAMADRGFPFADDLDWDLLVRTFEAGRLANQIIWIALGILEGNAWGFRELADWRDALEAVDPGARRSEPEMDRA